MDNRQLAPNLDEVSFEESFYDWLRDRSPGTAEDGPEMLACNSLQELQEIGNTLHLFAEVVADQITEGQTVDGCHTRLSGLRIEREQIERKLHRITINQEKEEALLNIESKSRCELIKDLQTRLLTAEERTTACLRLAKKCGETARREWEIKNRKPLEELALQSELLHAQLSDILKENACTEEQLLKCCEERKREIEATTLAMNSDIDQRQQEVDQLKREVLDQSSELKNLEVTLSNVTIEYDAIMEQRHKEAEEILKRRREQRRQEIAAIKIQRWFRMVLLRTIKTRKKRKKAKRKVSKEVKKEPADDTKKTPKPQAARSDSEVDDGKEECSDHQTTVAISVLQKLTVASKQFSPSINENVDEEIELIGKSNVDTDTNEIEPSEASRIEVQTSQTPENKTLNKNRKPTSSIQSITVKKNKIDQKSIQQEIEIPANSKSNRSSQTDNRVPKSKKTF